jgi:hypothetical protein
MKKFLLTLSIVLITFVSFSQTSILEVVSPAGGYFEGSNISVSWTLGETVIDTWVNEEAGIMVTSGFQQGDFTITGVADNPMAGFTVKMFPNPAKTETSIKVNLPVLANVDITVLDVTGRTVIQEQFNPPTLEHTHTLNVSTLKPGIYLIRVNSGTKLAKVLKFVKE